MFATFQFLITLLVSAKRQHPYKKNFLAILRYTCRPFSYNTYITMKFSGGAPDYSRDSAAVELPSELALQALALL